MGQHLAVYQPKITTVPKPPAGYTVLDVRKPPEWNKCHVDGAIHADLSTLPLQVPIFLNLVQKTRQNKEIFYSLPIRIPSKNRLLFLKE